MNLINKNSKSPLLALLNSRLRRTMLDIGCLTSCQNRLASPRSGRAKLGFFQLAERVGFEPTIPVKVCLLSKQVH